MFLEVGQKADIIEGKDFAPLYEKDPQTGYNLGLLAAHLAIAIDTHHHRKLASTLEKMELGNYQISQLVEGLAFLHDTLKRGEDEFDLTEQAALLATVERVYSEIKARNDAEIHREEPTSSIEEHSLFPEGFSELRKDDLENAIRRLEFAKNTLSDERQALLIGLQSLHHDYENIIISLQETLATHTRGNDRIISRTGRS